MKVRAETVVSFCANVGMGPAQIKGVNVVWQGQRFESFGPMAKAVRAAKLKGEVDVTFIESFIEARTLRPGESVHALALRGKTADALCTALLEDETWRYAIVYASLYGQCWRLEDGETTELDACP